MRLSSRLRRSAIDATRFTATSPHAYSKPSPLHSAPSSSSTSSTPRPQFQRLGVNPQSSPNRKGPLPPTSGAASSVMVETPAEKVARLRAARMAEKAAQFSRWDKAVVRGRGWADRAHKITVYFLVTFSVVAAAITAFALTDMILHNRRKRTAFYAEQRALYADRLLSAIEVEKAGLPLDEDQLLILNRERARVQAEEEKKERGWGDGIRGWVFGGLKQDEEEEGMESEQEVLGRIGVGELGVLEGVEGKLKVDEGNRESALSNAVEGRRMEGERELEAGGLTGGPLDRMADAAVEEVKNKSAWLNWGR